MSSILTQNYRRQRDHFQPEDMDPQEQRKLRGQLEQIDFTAYLANKEILGQSVGRITVEDFSKMAARTAQARGRWVSEALRLVQSGSPATADQVARIAAARTAYEELAEAYEGLRRMLERGYISLS